VQIRIVVADQSEARFYELSGVDRPLELVGRMNDPKAHLHDRDFKSDRPGRVFDSAPPASGRRGARSHHSTGSERSPRRHEAELFARQIAEQLERAKSSGEFEQFVLIAGPRFLGALRAALSPVAKSALLATVAKDLVHQPEQAVRDHLPPEAVEALAGRRRDEQ
jgi:protein required for attachment to host cells